MFDALLILAYNFKISSMHNISRDENAQPTTNLWQISHVRIQMAMLCCSFVLYTHCSSGCHQVMDGVFSCGTEL